MDKLIPSADYQIGYKDGYNHYEKMLRMVLRWVSSHTAKEHQMDFLEYILFHDPANKDNYSPL